MGLGLGIICLFLDLMIIIENFSVYQIRCEINYDKKLSLFKLMNLNDIILLIISVVYLVIVSNNLLEFEMIFVYPILRIVLDLLQLKHYKNDIYRVDNKMKKDLKNIVGIFYFLVYTIWFIISLYYLYKIIENSGYFYAKGSEGMSYLFFDFEIFNIFVSISGIGVAIKKIIITLINNIVSKIIGV